MDESSSNVVSVESIAESDSNYIDSSIVIPEGVEDHQAKEYETIVVMTEDDYELGTWGMIGVGAAGGLLILSIGIATVLRILRSSM